MPRKALVFRPIVSLCALILLAGSIVLLFLIILAGAFNKFPLNRIFFLQADTNGIPNAPQGIAHWTLYNHCSTNSNGLNINCIPNKAAYPIVPQDNFHTRTNIPNDFFKHRKTFFYLSRFAFAFYLIDLFFAVCAFFTGILALCSGGIATVLTGLLTTVTLFFMTFTACIMTAAYTMAARAFRKEGRFARVGVKAMSFTWTIVALLFLSLLLYALSYALHRHVHHAQRPSSPSRRGLLSHLPGRRREHEGAITEKGLFSHRRRGSAETSESQRGMVERERGKWREEGGGAGAGAVNNGGAGGRGYTGEMEERETTRRNEVALNAAGTTS